MIYWIFRCALPIGFVLLVSNSYARDIFDGPVFAQVDRVIDGDTIAVSARIWVNQSLRIKVRVRGIDAPEKRGRCAHERNMAKRASAYVRAALSSGHVKLSNISGGKYWGRVIADVTTAEGNSVAKALLRNGLVRPYRGRKRQSWCKGPRQKPIVKRPRSEKVSLTSREEMRGTPTQAD